LYLLHLIHCRFLIICICYTYSIAVSLRLRTDLASTRELTRYSRKGKRDRVLVSSKPIHNLVESKHFGRGDAARARCLKSRRHCVDDVMPIAHAGSFTSLVSHASANKIGRIGFKMRYTGQLLFSLNARRNSFIKRTGEFHES